MDDCRIVERLTDGEFAVRAAVRSRASQKKVAKDREIGRQRPLRTPQGMLVPILNSNQFGIIEVLRAGKPGFTRPEVLYLKATAGLLAREIERFETKADISDGQDSSEKNPLYLEQRLAVITVARAPDAIFWADSEGRLAGANPATAKLLSYSHPELLVLRVSEIDDTISPEEWPLFWNMLMNRETIARESFLCANNGGQVPVDLSATYLRINGMDLILFNARDTRARKRIEAAGIASEERYVNLFETAAALLWTTDLDGSIVSTNRAFERLIGYERDDLNGRNISMFVPEKQEASFAEMMGLARKDGSCTRQLDFLTKGGKTLHLHVSTRLVLEQDRPAGIQGVGIDISDEVSLRKQLRELEEYYRGLIENALELVTVLDEKGVVRYVSPSITEILGYPMKDWLETDGFRLVHAEDLPAVRETFDWVLKSPGKAFKLRYRMLQKDGSWRMLAANVKNLLNTAVGGVAIHARDVTEIVSGQKALMESEAALRRQQTELAALAGRLLTAREEERRQMSRELHDDFNQRLTGINLELSTLEKETGLAAPARRRLKRLRKTIISLSEDLREAAHRLHPPALQLLGLRAALRQLCIDVAHSSGMKILYTEQKPPLYLPEELELSFYRIAQEACHNAIRHSQADKIAVRLTGGPNRVRLIVEDDGIGFDPDLHLLKGGLGMLTMREQARQAGIQFSIESRPAKGTKVIVEAEL